jgi:hypothetical protein
MLDPSFHIQNLNGGFAMTKIGNEDNMKKVQQLMQQAQQVNLGADLKNAVDVDFTSSEGNVYQGRIVFKRPTIMDYMRMGGIKSEILRQSGVVDLKLVDPSVQFMAHVISVLKTLIVKSPEWLLDIDSVQEPELLFHVFSKYEVWDDSFRKPDAGESEGDSATTGSTEILGH